MLQINEKLNINFLFASIEQCLLTWNARIIALRMIDLNLFQYNQLYKMQRPDMW